MNNYNGRKTPSVSQYVANLNTIPSAHDLATQQQDDFKLEDDLALFTNTEFYDFDLGENIQQAPPLDYDPMLEERTRRGQAGAHKDNAKSLDFVNADFQFPSMTTFIPTDPSSALPPPIQSPYPQPLPAYPTTTPTSFPHNPSPGEKHPFETSSSLSPRPQDDASRHAAEEDKRRRNTAASARFRVKKKQREQALEKAAKELSDKTSALESRISQLEMENRWLRNLVTEKTGNDDVKELWRQFRGKEAEGEGRKGREMLVKSEGEEQGEEGEEVEEVGVEEAVGV